MHGSDMKKLIPLIALAVLTVPATAQNKPAKQSKADKHARELADQKAASDALARGEILRIDQVLSLATAQVPGDVLKVKLERESWGFKYEVKVLAKNGRVREVEIDAKTGKLLKIEDD